MCPEWSVSLPGWRGPHWRPAGGGCGSTPAKSRSGTGSPAALPGVLQAGPPASFWVIRRPGSGQRRMHRAPDGPRSTAHPTSQAPNKEKIPRPRHTEDRKTGRALFVSRPTRRCSLCLLYVEKCQLKSSLSVLANRTGYSHDRRRHVPLLTPMPRGSATTPDLAATLRGGRRSCAVFGSWNYTPPPCPSITAMAGRWTPSPQ